MDTCPQVMQLGDILKYLPLAVVDTIWSFQDTNLVEFHDAISYSYQGAIEILWVSEGSIPGQPDLPQHPRPPLLLPVPPKGEDAVSRYWPASSLCHCWDGCTAAMLSWHWYFPGGFLLCGKGRQSSFWVFSMSSPPMRSSFGKRRCRRWHDRHVKIRVHSKRCIRHTVILGLLNIGHLKC